MRILVKWATLTLAIYLIAKYTGFVTVDNTQTAIFAALALGLLNTLVKPLLKLLTFPINFLTFGLFSLIINGFILTIVPIFIHGFKVQSFWYGVVAAILISLLTSLMNSILLPRED